MSPNEKKLLQAAYQHYQKTGDTEFSYTSPDSSDWLYMVEAARQLYVSGLINSDLDYIADRRISNLPGNIPALVFCLTEKALQELGAGRDSEM